MVEFIEVQGRTARVHIGVYPVFQRLALGLAFLVLLSLDGGYPGGRCGHGVKIEHPRVDELVQVHVSVVALQHLGAGIDAPDDALELAQLFGSHIGRLVQEHDVAELNLLYHQALQVVLADVLFLQGAAAFELVAHAEGVHHGGDAVHVRDAVFHGLGSQGRHGADGLGNGGGLADAAGFNHNIVELAGAHQIGQLGHQVHLEGAADAAVLEGHQAVVGASHDAAFFHQVGVYVHLADIVHDDGELDSLLVGEDAVEQCGFTASQIAGEKENRRLSTLHCYFHIFLSEA